MLYRHLLTGQEPPFSGARSCNTASLTVLGLRMTFFVLEAAVHVTGVRSIFLLILYFALAMKQKQLFELFLVLITLFLDDFIFKFARIKTFQKGRNSLKVCLTGQLFASKNNLFFNSKLKIYCPEIVIRSKFSSKSGQTNLSEILADFFFFPSFL